MPKSAHRHHQFFEEQPGIPPAEGAERGGNRARRVHEGMNDMNKSQITERSVFAIADEFDAEVMHLGFIATLVDSAAEMLDNIKDADERMPARPLTGLKWGEQVFAILDTVTTMIELRAQACNRAGDDLRKIDRQQRGLRAA